MPAMWAVVHPGYRLANIRQDSALRDLYDDAAAQLPNTDLVQVPGAAPQISTTPGAAQPYRCDWDTAANLGLDNDYFVGAIIHELARRMLKEANDRRRIGFWSDPGTEVRRVDSQAWWFQVWKW